jgi:hypothetical protein
LVIAVQRHRFTPSTWTATTTPSFKDHQVMTVSNVAILLLNRLYSYN